MRPLQPFSQHAPFFRVAAAKPVVKPKKSKKKDEDDLSSLLDAGLNMGKKKKK